MKKTIIATVIVAALGYFVDIYDLLIFSILRVSSLTSLHVPPAEQLKTGLFLLNMQMAGLILGGIFWGIIGDKKGRLSVLLGSIFLYSVANIANAFVTSIPLYGIWRLVAGFGLAGELGAGITLVCELMPKEKRGYGTTIVASIGVLGAVFAGAVGQFLDWRTAYIVGGCLGLLLLLLRVAVKESEMFTSVKENHHLKKGDFFQIFKSFKIFKKYISVILVGVPIWYVIGILVTFSPEFGLAFGVKEPISAGRAVMFTYSGLVLGDMACGLLSQYFKSRKKVLFSFILLTALCFTIYLNLKLETSHSLYWLCFPLGVAAGYWGIFVTNASEQFGTNLRATVTTTAPNFVRGSVIPLTALFNFLQTHFSLISSALIVGILCTSFALFALAGLKESFGSDLNYVE